MEEAIITVKESLIFFAHLILVLGGVVVLIILIIACFRKIDEKSIQRKKRTERDHNSSEANIDRYKDQIKIGNLEAANRILNAIKKIATK